MSTSPEVLEVRQVLAATLSATLVNGLLTVSDTSLTDTNNSLTTTLVGADLVISDFSEQFISAPAGGTLSDGGKTLTIPANLVTLGLTINAGGGDDFVNFQAIDGAFSANLVVDGGSGNDSVAFREGAVNVGVGSVNVTTENIDIISALTAGGAVNLTSTGDDKGFSNFAPITAGADSTFSADKMNFNNTVTVGSHTLTLIPGAANGPSDAINIGSTDNLAVDTLELSNSELNRITASQIVIGNADSGLITISAAIQLAGDSDVQVVSGYSLLFASGSSWATTNGDLSFSGGGTASGTGHLNGIELVNGQVSSAGTGNITLFGHGGNGADFNAGILARAGSVIQSTGTGEISLTGVGGAGTAENRGIQINDASITSTSGDIRLTGQGGQSTDNWNIGVWLVLGANVSASGDARIIIDGTGGSGSHDNNGVKFNGFGYGGATQVTSENGDIQITGQGPSAATDGYNRGIGVFEGTVIRSTGTAKITLDGTGGAGPHSGRGIEIGDAGTRITSASGDIQLLGQGGTGTSSYGVWIRDSAAVESTGSAKITIDGTAGLANDAIGVEIVSGAHVSSVDGDVTIHGHGADFLAGGANHGLVVTSGAVISSTGTAKITLDGTGGAGAGSSRGVEMADAGTKITSLHGDISITGQGGASDSGSDNQGVLIRDGVVIESTATTGIAAGISIDGTGGDGVGRLMGIVLHNSRVTSSGTGNITLVGHAGDGDGANIGIFALSGAVIESTGTGQISLTGVGGAGTAENRGIQINDASITSTSGDIRLTGQGGQGTQFWNIGVWLVLGANVSASGDARIIIDGTAGSGTDDNNGVLFNGFGYGGATKVTSENGDIEITGQGSTTGTGAGNRGICLLETGTIQSTGTAKITLNGTGGTGTYGGRGVELGYSALVTSAAGDIQITGQGGATPSGFGAFLSVGAAVESTGTAKITIDGTAGDSYDANGVWLDAAGISSIDGDITITGRGGNFLDSGANRGICIANSTVVQSTGTARIVINGTGGNSNNSSRGVEICDPGTQVNSATGDIVITGQAGAGVYGFGIWVYGTAQLQSTNTAKITLNGSGGVTGSDDAGVIFGGYGNVGPTLNSVNGDITINGQGGGSESNTYSPGVGFFAGTLVESTGTAKIVIDGVGGVATSNSRGVEIGNEGTLISSVAGDIQITGQGGLGTGDKNVGVWLQGGAGITAGGGGRITIDGTGGGSGTEDGGVLLNGFDIGGSTLIQAENGDIAITGHGSITGTGSGNRGIGMWDGAVIQSTGTGRISVNGTGGTGSDAADGVTMSSNGAKITSVIGDIQITGQGGTSAYAHGLEVLANAFIESTGTAKITINGTGGTGQESLGIDCFAFGQDQRISSVDGDITIIGQGGDALDGNQTRGIGLFQSAHIESTGLAKITLQGTGGTGASSSRGVEIADGGTEISSANGDIQITGQGGDNLYGFGVWVRGGAVVESTGTAKITVDGTGGAAGGNDIGVILGGYGSGGGSLTSINGDITVTGHGGNTGTQGNFNIGVGVFEGSVISSTGTASITIQGTGGTGTDSNRGIEIGDGTTKITSQHGDITITGTGGSGVSADRSFNVGVYLHDSPVVESTATEGIGAKITINGTGGAGNGSDVGVWMKNSAAVTSTLGDIVVTGSSNSIVGIFNRGVNLEGASIVSHGTGKITVDGTAGGGDGNEIGVYLERHDSVFQSVDGDISVVGRGGTSGGNNNVGVLLDTGGVIESLGNAKITVSGSGGQSSDSNIGVWVKGEGGLIRSTTGNITVTGTGGQGTSYANIGVVVNRGGVIESTDTARITIAGTGGTGVPDIAFPYGQDGVLVEHANSAIRSKNGDIQITGIAGGDAGSTLNHGVMLKSGVVETTAGGTANISITGTAGPGSTSFGIQAQSDSGTLAVKTAAGTGNITLISDSIYIDFVSQPAAISAGTNAIAISPQTTGTAINLGGTDAAGTLGLSDPELDRITAGALNIGNSFSGTITVSADITRSAATNMLLVSGGNVVIAGGQLDTHGGSLLLDSGAAPDVVNPIHPGVDATATTTTLDGDLSIAINGSLVDTGYTQFNVAGGVNLNGVMLQLSGSYIPQLNDSFVIVNNDGGEPITGMFNGLAEGTIFSFNGRSLQISYVGGSNGNDVVLTTVNLAPVAVDASIETNEDTPFNGTLQATDVDSSTLTYSIAANPTHGTVNITNAATGAYTYTPDTNYNGTDSFMFRAYDGQLNSNLATVSITILPVNDAPQLVLNGGAVTFSGKAAKKDGPIQIVPDVTVVDPDQAGTSGLGGGTLTISIDASVKTTKNKVKLHDTIGGISNASSLGLTTGALVSNGKLVLTIQLNAGTTTNDIQTFLRGITFSTKGPGLKLTPRTFQAQLTDAAGAASNLLQQTVNVTK